jgi:hypothetical protein
MAGRSDEIDAEPLDIVDRVAGGIDLGFTGAAGAGVHLADMERTRELAVDQFLQFIPCRFQDSGGVRRYKPFYRPGNDPLLQMVL